MAGGKGEEVMDEGVRPVRCDVDAILGDSLQCRIIGRGRVPVKLHIHAARPLDNRITAYGVRKWSHEHGSAGRLRCLGGCVEICHKIARTLTAERRGNRGLEPEY